MSQHRDTTISAPPACDDGCRECRKEGRLGFDIFDLVPVTRFSKDHKLKMLENAGRRLIKR